MKTPTTEEYNEQVNKSRTVDGLCAIADCLDGFEPEDNEYYQEVIESAKNYLLEA